MYSKESQKYKRASFPSIFARLDHPFWIRNRTTGKWTNVSEAFFDSHMKGASSADWAAYHAYRESLKYVAQRIREKKEKGYHRGNGCEAKKGEPPSAPDGSPSRAGEVAPEEGTGQRAGQTTSV